MVLTYRNPLQDKIREFRVAARVLKNELAIYSIVVKDLKKDQALKKSWHEHLEIHQYLADLKEVDRLRCPACRSIRVFCKYSECSKTVMIVNCTDCGDERIVMSLTELHQPWYYQAS